MTGSPIAAPAEAGLDQGRRERKKQRTREALIAAAMELFAAKGYEHTAVHEITDAVDVAERTFFRYFASKEDLVLSFVRDGMAAFAEALAARPAEEEPLTAARHAFLASLRQLTTSEEMPPYLSVLRLIDATPALLAAYLRYIHEHDEQVIAVLAQREGVDPVTDPRPRLLAAVIGALAFLANRDLRASGEESPQAMAAAFDVYADQVIPALTGHWARGA
ncbi:MAG TPA: TetR family transcriptional regulator [Streptosporangiaceae bacterium]